MNMGTRLNAIEIADVSLEFQTNDGPVRALSGVSLNIARGEFVSFIWRRRQAAPSASTA
jgi:NitT/TauT family transport system ATP-binding protein